MATEQNPYAASGDATHLGASSTARSRLYPIAIGLLVTSILHIMGGLSLFNYAYFVAMSSDAESPPKQDWTFYCMSYGITMLYSLLLASGAFSMMRRGSYLWAMTVCVLALIPILGPCYFAAIPFGLWGIIVLRRPDVRATFTKA